MRSLVAVLIVMASHGLGNADEGAADHAKADALFEEAQQLKQAGKKGEACAKYDEALSYNKNAVGAILNVALCNEEGGRVATALALFSQARDLAREHNLAEHKKAAEEHIAQIEGLVPHLEISFAEKAPQMKLVIDDKVFAVEKANDIRIDPGARHIVVTAPGRVPYETTATLRASQKTSIAIPALGKPVTVKRARKTVGKIVTVSGIALIGTGIGLGFKANSDYDQEFAVGNCMQGPTPMCNADGFANTQSALQLGTVGTVVGIVGIAAVGVGAYLWLFAPADSVEQNVAITPFVSPETAGIAAVGRF